MTEILNLPIKLYRLKKGKEIDAGNGIVILLIQNVDYSTNVIIKSTIDNDILVSTDISKALNMQFKSSKYCAFFDLNYNKKIFNFSMIFKDLNDLQTFVSKFVQASFEFRQQRAATEDELDRFISYLSLDKPEKKLKNEYTFPSTDYKCEGHHDNGKNSFLRIGMHSECSYVLRRYDEYCDLGLFTLDQDCEFLMSLPKIIDENDNPIIADDILNTNQDDTLLILDKNNPNQILNMNLNTGVVESHYDAIDRNGISHNLRKLMSTTSDYNEQKDGSTFLAFSDRNTMLFDIRESNSIVNQSDYKTSNSFICGKTTRSGYLAMGSEDGIVRLYDGPCKSKSMINFVTNVGGDPVISLDISNNEEWILATCPFYLCVFNVKAKSTGKSGFLEKMGKDKPSLTRLTIEPIHQQQITQKFKGTLPQFTTAKFQNKGNKIIAIIASIGNCLVSWDFRRIEEGSLPRYSIKFIGDESIVDIHPFDSRNNEILFMTDNSLTGIERNVKL